MEQDKWIQQLRDKLDGFEMDAPEGLWEDIEAALQKQGVLPVSKPRRTRQSRFITLRRWAVAASVAACLAGGGYWWWSWQEKEAAHRLTPLPVWQEHSDVQEVKNVKHEVPLPKGEAPKSVAPSRLMSHSTPHETIAAMHQEDKSPDTLNSLGTVLCESAPRTHRQPSPLSSPRRRRQPSINVYSDNGVNSYLSSNGVEMAEEKANSYHALYASNTHATRSRDVIYLASYEERQRHDRPISIGLSVSYPLSDRISVTSGAVVTWLHSEFENIIRDQTITRNQRLVYLGIPLSVNYRLWQYKGLKLYALAGGQADWNVSADTDTDGVKQEIERDRMQWSVHASAGLEFCPIPQLGFYLEPGVKYYFDNGSNMLNYFKDKPLNLNVQFGLRLNL